MRIYCVLCENIPLEFPYATPYNIGIKAACTDDCKISLKWNQEENYEKMEQYDGSRACGGNGSVSDACSGMETGAGQEIKGAPGFEGLEPVVLIGADANDFFDEDLAPDSVKQLYQDIDQSVDGLGTILQESLETAAK